MDKNHDFPIFTFDPTKDKLSDLPIYDRLDGLILFATSPSYINTTLTIEQIADHLQIEGINSRQVTTAMFIDRLIEDGYLKQVDNGYRSTVKAWIMMETRNGGYRSQVFFEKSKIQSEIAFTNFQMDILRSQNTMMEEQNNIQKSIRLLTVWIMVGTLSSSCLSIIGMVQNTKENDTVLKIEVATFLFVFLAGICLGLIAYLIIAKMQKEIKQELS